VIETARLRLRGWRDEDEAEFVRVTNTPAVMAHLGGVGEPARFAGMAARQRKYQEANGFCFWLVERLADGALLGFCGLDPVGLPGVGVADDVEVGWRFRADAWGQGYAAEAARASLAWAWANTRLPRVVAITVPANVPSWRLMERIGMQRRPDLDFDHPEFGEGHPLRAHITFVAERP